MTQGTPISVVISSSHVRRCAAAPCRSCRNKFSATMPASCCGGIDRGADRPATTGWRHRARSIPAGRAVPRHPMTDRRPIRCSTGMAARSRAAPADAAGRCRPEATLRRHRSAWLRDTTKALAPVACGVPKGQRPVPARWDRVFRPCRRRQVRATGQTRPAIERDTRFPRRCSPEMHPATSGRRRKRRRSGFPHARDRRAPDRIAHQS